MTVDTAFILDATANAISNDHILNRDIIRCVATLAIYSLPINSITQASCLPSLRGLLACIPGKGVQQA